jgi:hypothetical protein
MDEVLVLTYLNSEKSKKEVDRVRNAIIYLASATPQRYEIAYPVRTRVRSATIDGKLEHNIFITRREKEKNAPLTEMNLRNRHDEDFLKELLA